MFNIKKIFTKKQVIGLLLVQNILVSLIGFAYTWNSGQNYGVVIPGWLMAFLFIVLALDFLFWMMSSLTFKIKTPDGNVASNLSCLIIASQIMIFGAGLVGGKVGFVLINGLAVIVLGVGVFSYLLIRKLVYVSWCDY